MDKIFSYLRSLLNKFEGDVETLLAPGISYIEANGGAVALGLAANVLNAFADGTSWSVIEAAFVKQAESQGITLLEGGASAVLNAAKLTLLAANAGVTVAAAKAADAGAQAIGTTEGITPAGAAAAVAAVAASPSAVTVDPTPNPVTNPDHPDYVPPSDTSAS